MKRLGLVFVAMVVVMLIAAPRTYARTGNWHYYDGGWHWVDYGRSDVYRSRPVVVGSPVVAGSIDYSYDYWPRVRGYGGGPYGDNNEAFYGPGSVSDFIFGWRADRVLKMHEKDQGFRQEQERRAEERVQEKELFARASARAREQKLEEENQKMKEEIAELKKEIDRLLAEKSGK